jgi:hypothetical protein
MPRGRGIRSFPLRLFAKIDLAVAESFEARLERLVLRNPRVGNLLDTPSISLPGLGAISLSARESLGLFEGLLAVGLFPSEPARLLGSWRRSRSLVGRWRTMRVFGAAPSSPAASSYRSICSGGRQTLVAAALRHGLVLDDPDAIALGRGRGHCSAAGTDISKPLYTPFIPSHDLRLRSYN